LGRAARQLKRCMLETGHMALVGFVVQADPYSGEAAAARSAAEAAA